MKGRRIDEHKSLPHAVRCEGKSNGSGNDAIRDFILTAIMEFACLENSLRGLPLTKDSFFQIAVERLDQCT